MLREKPSLIPQPKRHVQKGTGEMPCEGTSKEVCPTRGVVVLAILSTAASRAAALVSAIAAMTMSISETFHGSFNSIGKYADRRTNRSRSYFLSVRSLSVRRGLIQFLRFLRTVSSVEEIITYNRMNKLEGKEGKLASWLHVAISRSDVRLKEPHGMMGSIIYKDRIINVCVQMWTL